MHADSARSSATRAVAFAETHWSMVLLAQQQATPLSRDALETLCRTYWYPLYGYVRRCGHDPATAQDLTQDFFAHFVGKECLGHVDRSKGKFRSFLLASAKNFLSNQRVKAKALKRGGGCTFLSLNEEEAEDRFSAEALHTAAPEKVFDRAWALTVLENALQQLRAEYENGAKRDLFDVLQGCLSGASLPPNAELAARLDTSEAGVKMATMRLRRRFGQILRAQVAQTVAQPADIDDELRHLFAVLAS